MPVATLELSDSPVALWHCCPVGGGHSSSLHLSLVIVSPLSFPQNGEDIYKDDLK